MESIENSDFKSEKSALFIGSALTCVGKFAVFRFSKQYSIAIGLQSIGKQQFYFSRRQNCRLPVPVNLVTYFPTPCNRKLALILSPKQGKLICSRGSRFLASFTVMMIYFLRWALGQDVNIQTQGLKVLRLGGENQDCGHIPNSDTHFGLRLRLSFSLLPKFDQLSEILIFNVCQHCFNRFLDSQFMHLAIDIIGGCGVFVRDCFEYPRSKLLN